MTSPPQESFFARPVVAVARALLGCTLLVEGVGGVIVETEAYDRDDPASHSFAGPRPRNAAMFGPVGRLYVYRAYGLHLCANIVAGTAPGSAVLLRAIEPTAGLATMRARRGLEAAQALCGGPGRLTQALGIGTAHDGAALAEPPFVLHRRIGGEPAIAVGPRIGISKGVEAPWRFGLAGSRFVSRPFPRA